MSFTARIDISIRAMPGKLDQAIPSMVEWFEVHEPNAYRAEELVSLLDEKRIEWNIPSYVSVNRFFRFLETKVGLKNVEVVSVGEQRVPTQQRFYRNEVDHLSLGLSLAKKSYLSHASAMTVLGLSDQLPRSLFISREQLGGLRRNEGQLSQTDIDKAFMKRQRETGTILQAMGMRFVLINGSIAKSSELTDSFSRKVRIRLTTLEKTLIDICIRPTYSGGIIQVLEAYRRARKSLDSHTLYKLLQDQRYVYPYHHAVGYLLEKAGYPKSDWIAFKETLSPFDFYLVHGMLESEYVPSWKLHVPRGL